MATKKQFDTPFDFDLTKMMGEMQVPGVDMDALLTSQRKNMEAIANANKLAYEGVQALMHRQAEILRQSIEEANSAASKMVDSGSPQDSVAMQAQLTKDAFEKSISNVKELAELTAKSNTEVMNVLNARFTQIMEELTKVAETQYKK